MEQNQTVNSMPPSRVGSNEPVVASNTKTVVMTSIITAIVTALVVGAGMYWFLKKDVTNAEIPVEIYNMGSEEITESSPMPDVALTGTYTNSNVGFSLILPAGWEAIEKTSGFDGSQYVNFSSPATKAEALKNQEYCTDNNDNTRCAPELPGASVVFQSQLTPSAGEKTQVTIGSHAWTKTVVAQSLYGEHEYSMQFPDGKTYMFTVYSQESEFLEALKTFQLR